MNVSGKRTSKWISMLLALAMLFSLLTVGVSAQTVADGTAENMVVLAAEEKGNVTFTYPKDIDPEKTELEFYAGFPPLPAAPWRK